jgi:hypothetical protein
MNKKLTFTFFSVLLICTALFMACQKSLHDTVASATGSTTGVAGSINIDGTSHAVTTGTVVIGNTYVLVSNTNGSSYPSISTNFTGTVTPAAGSYTANANYPTSGNCGVSVTPSTSITWTVVTCHVLVSSGSSKAISFNGATFTDGANTHTVSANLPF